MVSSILLLPRMLSMFMNKTALVIVKTVITIAVSTTFHIVHVVLPVEYLCYSFVCCFAKGAYIALSAQT